MTGRWALRLAWMIGIGLLAPASPPPASSATLGADCEADYEAKLRAARSALARSDQEAALRRLLEAETLLRRCEERGVTAPSVPEAREPSQTRVFTLLDGRVPCPGPRAEPARPPRGAGSRLGGHGAGRGSRDHAPRLS